jgi:endonuclease YncB( thermonuclease family)
MIGIQVVTCVELDRDRYKRMIGRCIAGGEDLGEWMVLNGLAVAYYRYSDDYRDAEQLVKMTARGIWRGPFVLPWDWQRSQRSGPMPPPAGCVIKGNINRSGERILLTAE